MATKVDASTLGEMEERVVQINRVAKVQKGGRRFNFSSIVVIGDGNGHVGIGMGKAGEVPESIRKGVEEAKKDVIAVNLEGTTIPHDVEVQFGSTSVLLRPARPGTGVIAGGGVRAVMEAAGVHDVLTKTHGSTNPVNVVRAAFKALAELESVEGAARRRGKPVNYFGRRRNRELAEQAAEATRASSNANPSFQQQPPQQQRGRGGGGGGGNRGPR